MFGALSWLGQKTHILGRQQLQSTLCPFRTHTAVPKPLEKGDERNCVVLRAVSAPEQKHLQIHLTLGDQAQYQPQSQCSVPQWPHVRGLPTHQGRCGHHNLAFH
jgi:hypothetical protein